MWIPVSICITYLVLDDIFGTVLSLYMHDNTQSLPSSEEVLICTSDTTAEEVGIISLNFSRLGSLNFIKIIYYVSCY